MEAQFEALSELVKNGQKLNFGQDFFVKFYQAFLYSDRWQQYIKGVGTTLLVTAIALVLGVVLGAIVAMVRVGYAQQKPHHRNPILTHEFHPYLGSRGEAAARFQASSKAFSSSS